MEMQLNSKQLDLLLDTVDFEKARGDRAKTRLKNLKAYIAQAPPLMMKILAVYILDWDLSKKEGGEANWDIPLWIGDQADRDKIFRSLTFFSAVRKLAGKLRHSEYIYREFPKKVLFTIKTGSESTAKCDKILSDSLKEVSLIISRQLIESVKASLNNVKNRLNQVSIHMPQGDSSFIMMSDILQEAKRIQVAISKNVLKGFDNSESEGLRSDLRRGLKEALDLSDETTIISEKNVTEFINLQLLTFAIFDTEGLVLRAYTFVPSRGIMRAGRVDSSGGPVFILKEELSKEEKLFFSLLADSWKRQDTVADVSKRATKMGREMGIVEVASGTAHNLSNIYANYQKQDISKILLRGDLPTDQQRVLATANLIHSYAKRRCSLLSELARPQSSTVESREISLVDGLLKPSFDEAYYIAVMQNKFEEDLLKVPPHLAVEYSLSDSDLNNDNIKIGIESVSFRQYQFFSGLYYRDVEALENRIIDEKMSYEELLNGESIATDKPLRDYALKIFYVTNEEAITDFFVEIFYNALKYSSYLRGAKAVKAKIIFPHQNLANSELLKIAFVNELSKSDILKHKTSGGGRRNGGMALISSFAEANNWKWAHNREDIRKRVDQEDVNRLTYFLLISDIAFKIR